MANINTFVIDHVLRGIMLNKNGEYMWSINQITNPSLSVSLNDAAQAVDALGTVIAEFDRGRNASFSAENSIWDLSLYASQLGQDVKDATKETIVCPAFEEISVSGTSVTLAHTPISTPIVYELNGDGTLGAVIDISGSEAGDGVGKYDAGEIEFPTDIEAKDIIAIYEYNLEKGAAVVADAINMPKKGKFVLEVLGCDVCDQEKLIHAYVVFPTAKLSGNVDYTFTTDGTHPFEITAMQEYCDKAKKLFEIVIPDEE